MLFRATSKNSSGSKIAGRPQTDHRRTPYSITPLEDYSISSSAKSGDRFDDVLNRYFGSLTIRYETVHPGCKEEDLRPTGRIGVRTQIEELMFASDLRNRIGKRTDWRNGRDARCSRVRTRFLAAATDQRA